jgi:hypothetical protein
MKKIFILTIIFAGLIACKNNVAEIYPQGFSALEFSFDAGGGDTVITSQRDEWTIVDYISINNISFGFPRCIEVFPENGYNNRKPIPGTCSDSMLTVKYDFLKDYYIETTQIKTDWFTITKENLKKLSIRICPNATGNMRIIRLNISDKSGTRIIITQSADSNTKSGQDNNYQYRNEIFPEIYYKFP